MGVKKLTWQIRPILCFQAVLTMLFDKFATLIKSLVARDQTLANVFASNDGDIYLSDDSLVFTIRGIYQFLCDTEEMTYFEFRTRLYQGNLNHELGKLGYEVVISDSTGNIDTSWYQLRPLGVV